MMLLSHAEDVRGNHAGRGSDWETVLAMRARPQAIADSLKAVGEIAARAERMNNLAKAEALLRGAKIL